VRSAGQRFTNRELAPHLQNARINWDDIAKKCARSASGRAPCPRAGCRPRSPEPWFQRASLALRSHVTAGNATPLFIDQEQPFERPPVPAVRPGAVA
jgi:hypothetical protein